jgi:broad specificity phosphatase PhoE
MLYPEQDLKMGKRLNNLSAITQLNNRYFAMRHGHSVGNQRGIIVSHPENGCGGFGLSEQGQDQVRVSLQMDASLDADTMIVSSDFNRALESAAIVRQALNSRSPIETDIRLRERNFGELELCPDSAYQAVWQQDERDPDSDCRGVESVNQVMSRVTELIVDLERRFVDTSLLLVSHGDALQILQTAFAGRDASTHRQLQHLQTAEIRCFRLA